ncbi:MAG: hypothetical protein HQL63_11595 [Magnetococcales bacterium]|nr:hypothetical protein [Magnetococcales bacterium]
MQSDAGMEKTPCPACWGTGRRCAKSECCGAEPDESPCPECYGKGWLERSAPKAGGGDLANESPPLPGGS